MAVLSGSTSLMLKVVFDPTDVVWEMDAVADEMGILLGIPGAFRRLSQQRAGEGNTQSVRS